MRGRGDSCYTAVMPSKHGPVIRAGSARSIRSAAAIRQQVVLPFIRQINTRITNAGRDYGAIRQAIANIPSDPSLRGLSQQAAAQQMGILKRQHTADFTRRMSRWLGVNVGPLMPSLGVEKLMETRINGFADLIRTIPARHHAALKQNLLKLATDKPFDEKALSDVLRQTNKLTGYNVRRIARDQTSKAVGALNQARQQQIGIVEYVWLTAEDERVRGTHAANNGLTFRWDQPPGTGNPGEDIQCRCTAIAVRPQVVLQKTRKPRPQQRPRLPSRRTAQAKAQPQAAAPRQTQTSPPGASEITPNPMGPNHAMTAPKNITKEWLERELARQEAWKARYFAENNGIGNLAAQGNINRLQAEMRRRGFDIPDTIAPRPPAPTAPAPAPTPAPTPPAPTPTPTPPPAPRAPAIRTTGEPVPVRNIQSKVDLSTSQTPGRITRFDLYAKRPQFRELDGYLSEFDNPQLRGFVRSDKSFQITQKMRNGVALTDEEQATVDFINKVATKNRSLEGRPVYRGEAVESNRVFTVGDTIDGVSPTSTTVDGDYAFYWAGKAQKLFNKPKKVMFEIHDADRVRAVITNSDEAEALLAPGFRLRIVKVQHNVTFQKTTVDDYVVAIVEEIL